MPRRPLLLLLFFFSWLISRRLYIIIRYALYTMPDYSAPDVRYFAYAILPPCRSTRRYFMPAAICAYDATSAICFVYFFFDCLRAAFCSAFDVDRYAIRGYAAVFFAASVSRVTLARALSFSLCLPWFLFFHTLIWLRACYFACAYVAAHFMRRARLFFRSAPRYWCHAIATRLTLMRYSSAYECACARCFTLRAASRAHAYVCLCWCPRAMFPAPPLDVDMRALAFFVAPMLKFCHDDYFVRLCCAIDFAIALRLRTLYACSIDVWRLCAMRELFDDVYTRLMLCRAPRRACLTRYLMPRARAPVRIDLCLRASRRARDMTTRYTVFYLRRHAFYWYSALICLICYALMPLSPRTRLRVVTSGAPLMALTRDKILSRRLICSRYDCLWCLMRAKMQRWRFEQRCADKDAHVKSGVMPYDDFATYVRCLFAVARHFFIIALFHCCSLLRLFFAVFPPRFVDYYATPFRCFAFSRSPRFRHTRHYFRHVFADTLACLLCLIAAIVFFHRCLFTIHAGFILWCASFAVHAVLRLMPFLRLFIFTRLRWCCSLLFQRCWYAISMPCWCLCLRPHAVLRRCHTHSGAYARTPHATICLIFTPCWRWCHYFRLILPLPAVAKMSMPIRLRHMFAVMPLIIMICAWAALTRTLFLRGPRGDFARCWRQRCFDIALCAQPAGAVDSTHADFTVDAICCRQRALCYCAAMPMPALYVVRGVPPLSMPLLIWSRDAIRYICNKDERAARYATRRFVMPMLRRFRYRRADARGFTSMRCARSPAMFAMPLFDAFFFSAIFMIFWCLLMSRDYPCLPRSDTPHYYVAPVDIVCCLRYFIRCPAFFACAMLLFYAYALCEHAHY